MEREFMDLFVVPNSRYVAPYESAYRDRWLLPEQVGKDGTPQVMKRLLMGESTLAVRRCFLEAGVEPVAGLAGPYQQRAAAHVAPLVRRSPGSHAAEMGVWRNSNPNCGTTTC